MNEPRSQANVIKTRQIFDRPGNAPPTAESLRQVDGLPRFEALGVDLGIRRHQGGKFDIILLGNRRQGFPTFDDVRFRASRYADDIGES